MGDITNMNDIERLLRSKEGKTHLEEMRKRIMDHAVVDVSFSNEVHAIATVLHLSNGQEISFFHPSHSIEALRQEFEDVLEREYYVDFPERKPK